MWPGTISRQYGSTSYQTLNDGQGNKIAVFPTYEQGAAAQFALWASKNYLGKTLQAAITKWSGHNSSASYARSLAKAIPGLSMSTVITLDFLKSENGWRFMKVQAQWEAGQPYPMTDEQWQAAQRLAFGSSDPEPKTTPVEPKAAEAPKSTPVPPTEDKETSVSLLALIFKFFFGRK